MVASAADAAHTRWLLGLHPLLDRKPLGLTQQCRRKSVFSLLSFAFNGFRRTTISVDSGTAAPATSTDVFYFCCRIVERATNQSAYAVLFGYTRSIAEREGACRPFVRSHTYVYTHLILMCNMLFRYMASQRR